MFYFIHIVILYLYFSICYWVPGVFKCIDQIFNIFGVFVLVLKDTFLVYLFWVLRISFCTSKSSRSTGNTNSWTVCFLIHSFEVHKLETTGKATTAKQTSIGKDAKYKYVEIVFFWTMKHTSHILQSRIQTCNCNCPPQKNHGAIYWIKQIFRFISKIERV